MQAGVSAFRRTVGNMNTRALLLPLFLAIGASQVAGQKSVTSFAERAAVRLLTFRQADQGAFTAGRESFTPEAWTVFQQETRGWVDEHGAPTFGSSFVSAHQTGSWLRRAASST